MAHPETAASGDPAAGAIGVVRFGAFEFDARACELRRQGLRIRVQEKPLQILELLLARPGEAVSRDELRNRLWPQDVFVDFDHSLNSAVSKLRDALRDPASRPQFIETLPRGYRFIAAVAALPPATTAGPPTAASMPPAVPAAPADAAVSGPGALAPPAGAAPAEAVGRASRTWWRPVAWAAAAFLAGAVVWVAVARLGPPPGAPAEPTALAVLPFQNLSGDPDQEFFSDGITDEMITQLGRVDPRRLRVIARTSSMPYKRTEKRTDQIGEELGVSYVLEGSVRRAGSRVRITAHLIRTRDQVRLWAQSYEREVDDILTLQTEVARAIADEIAVAFAPSREAPAETPKVSPAVYEAFLKGRYFLDRSPSGSALARSVEYFNEALRLDPAHAGAYANLADAYGIYGWGLDSGVPPREAYPKALAAAERALALDPTLAAAHVALARIRWKYEYDWAAAETTFRRAIELDPGAAAAHESYFDLLSALGRHEEAYAELQRAAALDPVSFTINYDFGVHFLRTGDYQQAFDRLRRAGEIDPTSGFVHYLRSQLYADQRRYPEAIAELRKAVALAPDSPHFVAALGHVQALAGDRAAAERAVAELEARAARSYVSPYARALLQVGLGNKDAAVDLLETAHRERDPWLSLLRVQPRIQSLRDQPRFRTLLDRMGLGERGR